MKGCIVALTILTLILGTVVVNAVFVRNATESLLEDLSSLSDVPDPTRTPEAVAAVRKDFESLRPYLGLTVAHATLDRVTEALLLLETQSRTAPADYASTRTLLCELVQEIARLEKLSVRNIL